MDKKEIGKRIEELRIAKGLSKKKIAQELQMPYNTYCSYEYGTREPGNDQIIKIAAYYEISVDDLLGIKKEPQPEAEVPGEVLIQFLIDSGYITDGNDLSDSDAAFLMTVLDLLAEWFAKDQNA